jgi:hypothetical protein
MRVSARSMLAAVPRLAAASSLPAQGLISLATTPR